VHAIREGKKKHQDYNEKNKKERWQMNGYLLWILSRLFILVHDEWGIVK